MRQEYNFEGEIRNTFMPYYDNREKKNKFKARPMLMIKKIEEMNNSDYSALPVSKISDTSKIDAVYDVKITAQQFPDTNLKSNPSYIRCNKLTTVSFVNIDKTSAVCNFSGAYRDEYGNIVSKVKIFLDDL